MRSDKNRGRVIGTKKATFRRKAERTDDRVTALLCAIGTNPFFAAGRLASDAEVAVETVKSAVAMQTATIECGGVKCGLHGLVRGLEVSIATFSQGLSVLLYRLAPS